MIAKLFNKIKLELEKQIENFKYELKEPKELDKADIVDGLEEMLAIPKSVQDWLPDKITLQKFKLDRTTDPDTFILAMEINPPDVFQPFTNILFVQKTSFEVETNKKIAAVASE